MSACQHCGRTIVRDEWVGYWVDPKATKTAARWREACAARDTYPADHQPRSPCAGAT